MVYWQGHYLYPLLLLAIQLYMRVLPVWVQAQLGCADPEQIGDQQAKGGGACSQVRYPGGKLLSLGWRGAQRMFGWKRAGS